MANVAKRGSESAGVLARHGETGLVHLRAEVHPFVKDAMIDIAQSQGVTLKAAVRAALDDYIAANIHKVA